MGQKIIFHILLFATFVVFKPAVAQKTPKPSGRSLRTIVTDKYPDGKVLIGGTTGAWSFGTPTGEIMDREFSYVTPENDFKQRNIHPDNSNHWNWSETDAWIEHIEAHDQVLRMHGPISPQCSKWTKEDHRTAEELEKNMTDFFTALCKRYNDNDRVISMDVVNEIIFDGKWHGDKEGTDQWELPWIKIGADNDENQTPLYIRKAFEIANEHATKKKLILNHHEGPEEIDSWNLIKETVFYLRERGLRVDGIGWQAHVNNGWSNNIFYPVYLRNLIDWAHQNDLEFHITEASVWNKNGNTAAEIEQQAEDYSKILEILLEKRNSGGVGWNIWHIDDNHGWHTEHYPSLFDTNYTAKPAYYAIQKVLENPPTTVKDTEDNQPQEFRLFQNYPNPFNPQTTIKYRLADNSLVQLNIYSSRGELITELINTHQPPGVYKIRWNAREVSSGIYFYKMTTGEFSTSKKCLVIK